VNRAYGFLGAPGVNPAHALPAPQAGLISALAQGVIQNNIPVFPLAIGALIGAACILFDEVLRRVVKGARMPPLAVGLGIYLPTFSTLMIVVGSIVGFLFNRRAARGPRSEATQQLGTLLASGLIVGEGLLGVIFAFIVGFSGNPAPIALVPESFGTASIWIGGVAFAAIVWWLYRWINRLARE
jgi:putative OPT family oligopeptide transporter